MSRFAFPVACLVFLASPVAFATPAVPPAAADAIAPAPVAEAEIARAVGVALEAVFDKPTEANADTTRPLVAAPEVAMPAGVTAFGKALVVKTRDEARTEQLAWFVYVARIETAADQVTVSYSTPYNGKSGKVSLAFADGAWTIADHQKMHSSSGARYFYGELYADEKCRDGSEMARRWNMYVDAMQALPAGRPMKKFEELPTDCPGKEFPDVASYRQMQKLLGK